MHICPRCKKEFTITDTERNQHELMAPIVGGLRIDMPDPKLCPVCRFVRRLAFRNTRELYKRVCPETGKSLITLYSPDKDLSIVDPVWWHTDAWDPLRYGRPWQSSRSFFEQLLALMRVVPLPALNQWNNENCDYTSSVNASKNCYMVFTSSECENLSFCDTVARCKDCIDGMILTGCEACYDCINGSNLYECAHCDDCTDTSFALWCANCHGCSDLIGCTNLRNKRFCILNKQYTEEEYKAEKQRLTEDMVALESRAQEAILLAPRPFNHEVSCEDVTGDYLFFCSNVENCYSSLQIKESSYCRSMMTSTSMQDIDGGSYCELCYECVSPGDKSYRLGFCFNVGETRDSYYCINCSSCTHCFGCVGLRHKEYCILNVQYTKEEYEALLPQVIAAMGDEWGDFLPLEASPFAYNETLAQDYFPLTEEQANAEGLTWHHRQQELQGTGKKVPKLAAKEYLDDTRRQELLNTVFTCPISGYPFKITAQELGFLIQRGLPLPQHAPKQRYVERLKRTVPPMLYKRNCMHEGCSNTFMSPYAEKRPEVIYCKACYAAVIQ